MVELIDAFDWSQTPLGPRASWPQSLRTTADLCVASRFPIVIYWGPELVTIYNDGYAPILRSKHPWALGRPCREVWAEIWDVIGPMLSEVMARGAATWSDDMRLVLERRGYPEECYFSFSFTPVQAESGGVGGVFTAVIETTERVIGARRLATLRELGQHVTDGGTVEQACARALRTLGGNPADIPFSVLYLLDPDHTRLRRQGASGTVTDDRITADVIPLDRSDTLADTLARVAAGGGAERVALARGEAAMVLPISRAGQSVPYGVLLAGISPHRELDEPYRGFYALLADGLTTVVANTRAYEEERARVEALAGIDRAKTAFFSNVSHEFRTPLMLMMGPLADVLASTSLDGQTRERLNMAHLNAVRLLKLVNTLLDFSRIEAGRIQASYQPTDLAAYTTELASVFRSAIERAGLRFAVDCAPLTEAVFVDREMWEKVVFNLLSNALKFTFDGEIALALRQVEGAVSLSVRDTGTGIPAEALPRVFDRFHRVENARGRSAEGTGIGLALVQELARLHGGTVRVESALDHGSTFTVTLPLGTAHLPRERIGAVRSQASTALRGEAYLDEALRWLSDDVPRPGDDDSLVREAAGPRPRARILVADDNRDMREYLCRLLEQRYTVEAVGDGFAALASARRHPPDLILTDVMMPGLDGFEVLAALRDDSRLKGVPVIMLSARAGEEARVEGVEAGADAYLVKPFSAKELLAHVNAHLELARVRQEVAGMEQAARAAIAASEHQRRRIARELHDEMGQQLTALALGLKAVQDNLAVDSPLREDLHRLQVMTVDVSRDIHRVVMELRPAVLDEMGLRAALSAYIGDWSRRCRIRVDFQSVGFESERLSSHVETTIYRVVQEALTNIVKHARASAVSVVLQRSGDDVVTIIEDDGCGFDAAAALSPASPRGQRRFGLVGMKERVTLAGGDFTVESQPGGTTIFARIPFARIPEAVAALPSHV